MLCITVVFKEKNILPPTNVAFPPAPFEKLSLTLSIKINLTDQAWKQQTKQQLQ